MIRQPFKSGIAIARGLEVWTQSILTLSVVAALCLVPCVVLLDYGASHFSGSWALCSAICGVTLIVLLIGVCCTPLLFDKLDGIDLSVGQSLAQTRKNLLSVVMTSGLLTAMVGLLTVAPLIARALGSGMPSNRRDLLIAFAVITSLILTAPFLVSVCLAPCVAVVERLSFTKSVKRSLELTKGNRLGVLGAMVSGGVVLLCISLVFLIPVVFLEDVSHDVGAGAKLAAWCLTLVIFTGGGGAIMSSIYHDLRVEKEGYGLQALSKIFA